MLAVALGANGHRVAVHIDVDVLFLEARQISFQQVAVALVLNIGLKLAQPAAPRAVTEECALHLIPGIISRNMVVSAFKRSQFKHNQSLQIYSGEPLLQPAWFTFLSFPSEQL